MKIVRSLAKSCGANWDCPEVYELDDGNFLVRGWKLDQHTRSQVSDMPEHEDGVIVPASLLQAVGR